MQAFIASLVPQLASGATDPADAAKNILAVALAAAARGASQTVITQESIAVAGIQPGNTAVRDQAVYSPMVAKATAAATAAGAAAGPVAGAAFAKAQGPVLVEALKTWALSWPRSRRGSPSRSQRWRP